MTARLLIVGLVFLSLALARVWFRNRVRTRLAKGSSQRSGDTPLLVTVVARHCGLCPAQKQIVGQIAKHQSGALRIEILDMEDDAERVRALGIMTVPTTLLFSPDGALAHINSGLTRLSILENQIAALPREERAPGATAS